ncbi:DoxX family protein [Actinotalea sp. Marseille-Q4924]|uniref:DoxX family protein n=1 Tax=Actinotalea sp. Marseille-Q4924 TaxID=2866571 RepID=UPI001CE47161|nr:DoxX family protein [Actinotalea sp. Marseille-Q4924]
MTTLPSGATSSRAVGLAALLGAAGALHLVRPRPFEHLIPRRLGSPRAWVLGSGVAELACAGALAHPATRRQGGWAAAALLVAVFPGNVTMAVRSGRGSRAYRVVAWARLPLQVPLVLWAARVAREGR